MILPYEQNSTVRPTCSLSHSGFFALFRMLCEAILHGYFQRRRDGSRCQYLCIVETGQMLFYVTKRRNDCDRGWKEYD